MKYVMNEIEVTRQIIEDDFFEYGYGVSVSCLSKYYKDNGLNIEETRNEILSLFKSRGVEFEKPYLFRMLNDITESVYKFDKHLCKVDSIPISKKEWDTIRALDDKDLEKLAFVLLVNVKAYGLLRGKENIWYNDTRTSLFQEAKLNNKYSNLQKQVSLLRKLGDFGMIDKSYSARNFAIKINYIHYDDNDIVFEVKDFDNIIYSYRKQSGEHIEICKECRKIFKKSKEQGKGKAAYCSNRCKEKAIKRQTRDRMKKMRQKNDVKIDNVTQQK